MGSAKEVLRSLVSLISSATEDAIREYEVAGCRVPSLDGPTEPQLPTDTTALKRALRTLEGAFHQLIITLTPPATTMFTRVLVNNDVACIEVAAKSGIADVLYGIPEGVYVSEIAAQTGLHEGKLLKVIHTLAATHCFRETAPQTFANNPLSLTLRNSNDTSALVIFRSSEMDKCAVFNFHDSLVDPEYGHSLDPRRSAWSWGIKEEMPDSTLFDFFAKHPKSFQVRKQVYPWDVNCSHALGMQRFHRAMTGISTITGIDGIINQFPWWEFPQGTTVCDVASGVRSVSIELARKYPNLRLTLQDLPPVIAQAQQLWAAEYPLANAEKRVNDVPFDFFKNEAVHGQDIYYIRQAIHNWADDDAVKILKNIRAGAKPSSRILSHDYILPSGVTSASGVVDAQALRSMLLVLNAGERTVEEFKTIGARAGLRFVKVWDFLETGLVEFVPDVA
ncbi:S-adenosyl-L-methionine-dependent methyltransferase [Auriscalpium vulgare]|uniref:S-adenosyl-L-methionine-dependent methyltransferase n=1 Tax=Auriscalpium vulgare TaxID=40419 RepID=A0ACB8RYA5_9AGAM|nr:S-adenosyl-L-methionine-dependent methyltransferase [Auriscalpium vulgare]